MKTIVKEYKRSHQSVKLKRLLFFVIIKFLLTISEFLHITASINDLYCTYVTLFHLNGFGAIFFFASLSANGQGRHSTPNIKRRFIQNPNRFLRLFAFTQRQLNFCLLLWTRIETNNTTLWSKCNLNSSSGIKVNDNDDLSTVLDSESRPIHGNFGYRLTNTTTKNLCEHFRSMSCQL